MFSPQVFSTNSKKPVAYHQLPVTSHYPKPEWVEQDPLRILDTVVECINETVLKLKEKGFKESDVVTIGVTNQRETTILWDKITGKPFYNAIGNFYDVCPKFLTIF